MTISETSLLWVLGVLVTLLVSLVGAIYLTVIKNIETIKEEKDDEFKDVWTEVNKLKEKNHYIDTHHQTLCQKHEDRMDAIIERINVMDSKIKGQADFFNQRVTELTKSKRKDGD